MMIEQTYQQLAELGLHAFARTLREQIDTNQQDRLSFAERVSHLVDREWTERQQKRLERRLKVAKLREPACIEDIDYQTPRGLDRSVLQRLATSQWVSKHQNILVCGPTGIGKTFLLCALANKACRDGYTVTYRRVTRLTDELALARADGSYARLLNTFAKTDALVLDDWGMAPLHEQARRDLLEIIEDRYGTRSTLVASQIPTDQWHQYIGEPTVADAILDRLVHNSHRLQLKGASMRKKHSTLTDKKVEGN